MALLPPAKDAIAIARMVCDFEAGIVTVPFKRDFPVISSIRMDIFTRNRLYLKEVFGFVGEFMALAGYGQGPGHFGLIVVVSFPPASKCSGPF